MQRAVLTIPQGAEMVRETVRVESDPCPGTGWEGFMAFWNFIASLQTAPTLLRHTTDCPAEVKFKHTGTAWVAESTSTYAVRDGSTNPAPAA